MSKIEYVYWNDPILTSYTDEEFNLYGPKHFRQVSQITYYGPYEKRFIYIDYDDQCHDIFIYDDKIYSVNGGKVLYVHIDGARIAEIYDISIKEILEHLIEGDFDARVTWTENGLPDTVLTERVFQAPLNQIDVYPVPSMPSIPEETINDFMDDFMDGYEDGYEDGLNDSAEDSIQAFAHAFDSVFESGFELGYSNGVNLIHYDTFEQNPECCVNCDRMRENQYNDY